MEHRARALLTEEQVKEIKHYLRLGQSQKALASRYGVTIANISSIYRGKTWKKVQ